MKKILSLVILLFTVLSCEEDTGLALIGFENVGGDRYNDFEENPFIKVSENPVSTFAIDADGGSYANVRSHINVGLLPPKEAVRTEELLNFFPMEYANSNNEHPIGLNGEVSTCPWQEGHKIIRIGIQGNRVEDLPASNLVLLIDVSGSMSDQNKLALLQKAFIMMVDEMKPVDRVAIVTYAGSERLALASTPASEKATIKGVINDLASGGGTAGAQGIITAYRIAEENFIEGGNNRIILGTDGDFNVGISSQEELIDLIEDKRDQGIFLTVVGVGHGNLNDAMMEQVADHGNGTYEYLDSEAQARKIFVEEYHKFYPAAKDVKVQVHFNSAMVDSYRLIGYENRLLEDEDFENDSSDAGEISVGQSITALYEIKPAASIPSDVRASPTFSIDFRYKNPGEDTSIPLTFDIYDEGNTFDAASESMRFAGGVAAFGMLLRDSPYAGTITYDDVIRWIQGAHTYDPFGYRADLLNVLAKAKDIR